MFDVRNYLYSKSLPVYNTNSNKASFETLFRTLLENNALLHNEVARLKKEHSKAISRLSRYYEVCLQHKNEPEQDEAAHTRHTGSSKQLTHSLPSSPATSQAKGVKATSNRRAVHSGKGSRSWARPVEREPNMVSESDQYETPEEFDRDSDKLSVTSLETYRITYISSTSSLDEKADAGPANSATGRYASPGMLAVGRMWDNFAVEDFSALDFPQSASCSRTTERTAPKAKNQSSPRPVTVPKPFKMTTREANTIKKKNRSMALTEEECSRRQALEEAECRKKFHANPMPASTLLPLYELINARNEQRRELVKRNNANMLRASQRPFMFSKKDEERKELMAKLQKKEQEEEAKRLREMASFKARPMRPAIFDSAVDEELLEREEYRKIKIQMRAEKLLADAKGPSRMESAEAMKRIVASSQHHLQQQAAAVRRGDRPRFARKIPDYNRAYFRMQQELATKKQSKLATVSEPFTLHTERRAKGRPSAATSAIATTASTSETGTTSHPKLPPPPPPRRHPAPAPPPHPTQMTETARRRQLLAKERLAEVEERESALVEQLKAKRMKAKEMQKMVAQKCSVYDMGEMLRERSKSKTEEFK